MSPLEIAEPSTARLTRSVGVLAVGLVLLTLTVRLLPAWLLRREVADVLVYRDQGETIRSGDNIYAHPIVFPYTPYSQFLPAWALGFADKHKLPFDFVVKLPSVIADAAAALLIFFYLYRRRCGLPSATAWTLLWALNPVSILISGFHGNLMSVVPFFTLGAYVAAREGEKVSHRGLLLSISSLMLGIAVAMRSYPVLLLPAFLLLFCRTLGEVAVFTAGAALPAAASSIPYLIFARQTFLREVLSYEGNTDFGWVSVLRIVPHIQGGELMGGAFDMALLQLTKGLFLYAYAFTVCFLLFFRRASLGRALLVPLLLFYALYAGVAAQYLVWILPLAIALRERWVLAYTIIAGAALVTFYVVYHPGILTGRYLPISASARVVAIYAICNVLLVALACLWTARIVGSELRGFFGAAEPMASSWFRRLQAPAFKRLYLAIVLLLSAVWLRQVYLTADRARAVWRTIQPRGSNILQFRPALQILNNDCHSSSQVEAPTS